MTRFASLLAGFVVFALAGVLAAPAAHAQVDPEDLVLTAPDGTPAVIDRDDFGVPHIRAGTETALFYAQGYAIAQDRLFQLEQFRRAATGRLSEVGLGSREGDRQTRRVFYTEEERQNQFDRLTPTLGNAYENYVAGINAYIDSAQARPAVYQPAEFVLASVPLQAWDVTEAIAVTQFLIRRFGGSGGDELARCQDLRALGMEQFNEEFPINDPEAPVTILDSDDPEPPGYPDAYPVTGLDQCPDAENPQVQPASREITVEVGGRATTIPSSLGSFATLINQQKSASGQVMLLGAPQLQEEIQKNVIGQNNVSNASEVELQAPGLHIGGLQLAGIPGVILGRNEHHAWSLTTGRSDLQDTFIETTETSDTLSQNRYLYDGEMRDFMAFEAPDLDFAYYRTVHGPVVGRGLESNEVYTRAYTFWKEELDMAEAFNEIWRAQSLSEVEDAVADVPVNFNFFYADREQNVHYWHLGRFPDRGATGIDPRLPHLGTGEQDWEGFVPLSGTFDLGPGQMRADFVPFENLPQAQGTEVSQDFFVNWNNKPVAWWDQGDNVPWIGDQRVDSLYAYVPDITPFSYADLKGVPDAIDDFGTYQQATLFGETRSGDLEQNTVPPGQSDFLSLQGEVGPHYNDQWNRLRETDGDFLGEKPEDFRFKNMLFRDGLHAFSGTEAYRFDSLGVAVEPTEDASGLALAVSRATDTTQGAPASGTLPAQDPELAVEGAWTLVDVGNATGAPSVDACFDLDPLTAPREDVTFSGLQVYRRAGPGAPWETVPTELRNDENGEPQQICAAGVSSFGQFAVGAAPSELPVELARFTATRQSDGAVRLAWRTLGEDNNARFVVERQVEREGGAWTKVGTRQTRAEGGTSAGALAYALTDEDVPFTAERLTYRLRQIDRDGTARIAGRTNFEVGAPQSFALMAPFPNPFRQGERVRVRYALPEAGAVELALFDARGRRVRTLVDREQAADRHEVSVRAGGLASGTYYLRLRAGGRTASQSVVLVR